MRYIGLLLGVALLSGCTQYVWMKDGASLLDYRKDAYECERDMRQSGYYGSGLLATMTAEEFGERCMMARGYNKVPADQATVTKIWPDALY